MHRAQIAFLIGMSALTSAAAFGQTSPPAKAHLTMWGRSDDYPVDLRDPTNTSPLTWDTFGYTTRNPLQPDINPEDAADDVFSHLQSDSLNVGTNGQPWIDHDHMSVFVWLIGQNLDRDQPHTVNQADAINPDSDPRTLRGATWFLNRTFFYPNDRLPGLLDDPGAVPGPGEEQFVGRALEPKQDDHGLWYYDSASVNRSYRHPFLLNATQASPLRLYMTKYANRLKSHLVSSAAGPLQGGTPSFYFDVEGSHIIQAPNQYAVRMLWFLTKAMAPDENNELTLSIWNTFKVPGSDGWTTPVDSELNGHPFAGFRASGGKTLNELYQAEAARQDPTGTDTHWPRRILPLAPNEDFTLSLEGLLNHYSSNASTSSPDREELRPIMLWWYEVCSKAEAQVWENAIFEPLHNAFPSAKLNSYQFATTDGKVDDSATVRDIGTLPTPSYPDYDWWPVNEGLPHQPPHYYINNDAPPIEQLPRAIFGGGHSNENWKTGGAIGADGTQRRSGFANVSIQGTNGDVAQHVADAPEFYFGEPRRNNPSLELPTYVFTDYGPHPTAREWRMDNPSLPTWAQIPPTLDTAPTDNTHDFFRWREHIIFHRILQFRQTAESCINSDHLGANGNQAGQRQSMFTPWLWQQLPNTNDNNTLIDLWRKLWSARMRSVMAMLRAKAAPEWAIFYNPNPGPDPNTPSVVQYDDFWYRTAQQRDQVFTSVITDYTPLTGTIDGPSNTPLDADRLNYTLRKVWGGNPVQRDYTVENISTQPIAANPGHTAPPGRMTRTEVNARLFPHPWLSTCGPLPSQNAPSNLRTPLGDPNNMPANPDDDGPHPSVQLAGSYEIYVETSATIDAPDVTAASADTAMMVQAYNYYTGTWDQLPLEPLDNSYQPIFTAPMTVFKSEAGSSGVHTTTVKTRRKYLLKEPQFIPPVDGQLPSNTAQYTQTITTIDESYSTMRLKVVQVAPGGTSLKTSLDLVQVIPLCAYDNYTDNVFVPRHTTVTDTSGEADDAELATVTHGIIRVVRSEGAVPDDIDPDCMINPVTAGPSFHGVDFDNSGPMFLTSAFCRADPSGTSTTLTNSSGQPIPPGTLFIELPSWVRMDSDTAMPLLVSKLDSNQPVSLYNYAGLMKVEVRSALQSGRSSVIAISGLTSDNIALMEGTYVIHPNLESGALVIDSDVTPSEPVPDFEVRFTLLSDCNNNSIPDGCEIARQLDPNGGSYEVDLYPPDNYIDSCQHRIDCDPDFNQDGNFDQGDVDSLINIVAGGANPEGFDGDFNQDGNIDQGDVDSLIDVIAGHPCPLG